MTERDSYSVPIIGKCGDIVLAHYQLANTAAPNLSGDIRYMCFFKLSVRGIAGHRVESMFDVWRHWPRLLIGVSIGHR